MKMLQQVKFYNYFEEYKFPSSLEEIKDEMLQAQMKDASNCSEVFKNMNVDFDKEVEIIKIWPTRVESHLQIIAKDHDAKVVIVLTWDFVQNMEATMFQVKCDFEARPENYIVKGMNQKYNYFVNEYQIYDLEYNIPLQVSTNNTMRGTGISNYFMNQRKIYRDGTRSLSIDHPNLLNFPLSWIDLLFWTNVEQLGSKASVIQKNTKIYQFN